MKKVFFLAVLVFSTITVFSQENKTESNRKSFFGVKAGFNLIRSNNTSSYTNPTTSFGYQLGGTLNVPMSEHFSFQPELLFVSLGYSNKNSVSFSNGTITENTKYRNSYLQIPLNFKYAFSSKIDIDLGPNVGFLLNSKKKYESIYDLDGVVTAYSKTTNNTSNSKKLILGVNLGTNYYFTEKIYTGFRYTLFINNYQTLDSTLDNSVFSLSLGYNFK